MRVNRANLLTESAQPLTREDLAEQACDCPECRDEHVLMLAPACHPEGRIVVAYDKRSGRLTLGCEECHTLYTAFQIAYRVVH
jgi:hypothetical protein